MEVKVQTVGKIYLVGAGPGDPELLSVKALRLIRQARVVVYDRLIAREIMRLVPEGATRVYVGKATGRHTLTQAGINQLLVDLGRKGQQVVRLKGGDPFVFGRGGEEALALAAAGIAYEIVPGITSAQACAAYAGIPLTHRGLAHSVRFLTGHRSDYADLQLDRAALGDRQQTLVVYMGLANVSEIVGGLTAAGLPSCTPAAVIERGTTPRQRTFLTTLSALPETVSRHRVEAPALLVIGAVVDLAHTLDWFAPGEQPAELCYG